MNRASPLCVPNPFMVQYTDNPIFSWKQGLCSYALLLHSGSLKTWLFSLLSLLLELPKQTGQALAGRNNCWLQSVSAVSFYLKVTNEMWGKLGSRLARLPMGLGSKDQRCAWQQDQHGMGADTHRPSTPGKTPTEGQNQQCDIWILLALEKKSEIQLLPFNSLPCSCRWEITESTSSLEWIPSSQVTQPATGPALWVARVSPTRQPTHISQFPSTYWNMN